MVCDICYSQDEVEILRASFDHTYILCKFCRDGIIEYIEGLKEGREYTCN